MVANKTGHFFFEIRSGCLVDASINERMIKTLADNPVKIEAVIDSTDEFVEFNEQIEDVEQFIPNCAFPVSYELITTYNFLSLEPNKEMVKFSISNLVERVEKNYTKAYINLQWGPLNLQLPIHVQVTFCKVQALGFS